MRNYDFTSLNDKDFEILTTDLLTKLHGVRFERFKSGRDQGVDSRFFCSDGKEIIVQCKHWVRSGLSALINALEKTEVKKVKALNPKRYILVTSLELSRGNKQKIKDVLSPYIHAESDIFGKEDLNDLLGAYPEIERSHYKLWISSAAVLESIIHASICGRSDFALKDIADKRSYYVVTSNHDAAKKKLEELGAVLITGEPGIGKTTLAEQICLEYFLDEFELCVLADSIEEAEGIFKPGEKQIFYFDDFLGRNFLQALGRHEDSHIVGFIKRICRDKTKRFVLTSRTAVLNQGKRLSELFTLGKIDRNELEIKVDSLSELDRARILYNHIWFSDLDNQYIEQILLERRYRGIIKHKNFNPRLISLITDFHRVNSVGSENYWIYIEKTLANPVAVWEHPFENVLDDYGRGIVQLVVFSGGKILEGSLRASYQRLFAGPAMGVSVAADFENNVKTLIGSFLNRTIKDEDQVVYSLFNPSVADYVIKRKARDPVAIESVFLSLRSIPALRNLNELVANNLFTASVVTPCLIRLANDHLSENLDQRFFNYKAVLANTLLKHISEHPIVVESINNFANQLSDIPDSFEQWANLCSAFEVCLKLRILSSERVWNIVRLAPLNTLDSDDFHELSKLLKYFPTDIRSEFEAQLKTSIVGHLRDFVQDEFKEQALLSGFFSEDDYPEAERLARSAIEEMISEYEISFNTGDVDTILEGCDIYQIIHDNQSHYEGEDDEYDRHVDRGYGGPDQVDELFQVDLPPR